MDGLVLENQMGLPKIRATPVGVPIIGTIVFWGFILGSPYFGKVPDLYRILLGHIDKIMGLQVFMFM